MPEFKEIYRDIIIPQSFQAKLVRADWEISRSDFAPAISRLLETYDNTGVGNGKENERQIKTSSTEALSVEHLQGRGRYPVAEIAAESGERVEVVIKTCKRGGLSGKILPDLYTDIRRPLNELAITVKARDGGVPVPEILGIQIKNATASLHRVRIIYQRVPNTVTLAEIITNQLSQLRNNRAELYRRKRALISAIAGAVRKLHQAGIYHHDLNIRNILIQADKSDAKDIRTDAPTKVYLIDFDKSVSVPLPAKGSGTAAEAFGELPIAQRAENLIRLNRSLTKLLCQPGPANLRDIITGADRLRLLEEYFRNQDITKKHKARLIRQCLLYTRLHKWWWHLWGFG